MSRHAVRQAERVKEANPELFEQVKAGNLPLRAAERQIERRTGASKGQGGAAIAKGDAVATDGAKQATTEDQARDARPEPEPPERPGQAAPMNTLDGFLHLLVRVSATVQRHGTGEIADMLMNRIFPPPDLAIVRSALAHLTELDREIAERERGGRAA